jgi:hypothetical protein
VADHPLRPATRRCLGEPLPHQLADRPRAHPTAQKSFLTRPCGPVRVSGINPSFLGLSRSVGQVAHVLRTRSPLRHTSGLPLRYASLDLHVLGTPPAFVLSQDQTLRRTLSSGPRGDRPEASKSLGSDLIDEIHLPELVSPCDRRWRYTPRGRLSIVARPAIWLLAHCSVVKEPAGPRGRNRSSPRALDKVPGSVRGRSPQDTRNHPSRGRVERELYTTGKSVQVNP